MNNLQVVFQPDYIRRSTVVAIVVGTALNLINQPEAIFGEPSVNWWKVALTYAVPFFVATYGAYSALVLAEKKTETKIG